MRGFDLGLGSVSGLSALLLFLAGRRMSCCFELFAWDVTFFMFLGHGVPGDQLEHGVGNAPVDNM